MSDELEIPVPSKAEAIEFTANLRDKFENLCDAVDEVAKDLKTSQEIPYWQGAGYDSWLDWYQTEYEDQLDFLKETKLSIDARFDLVGTLANGGMSNRAIATTLGVNEKTVRNDLKVSRELDAENSASNEVDAAGQSVESVGHIDDDEPRTQTVATNQPIVINFAANTPEPNEDEKASLDNWLDTIDFGAMVIPVPDQQIIETDQSDDTPDYFTPRQPAPSWSPPQVQPLPPAKVEAYDDPQDNTPEFLGPPMTLQKAGAHNEDSEKHCKTCACNLLP